MFLVEQDKSYLIDELTKIVTNKSLTKKERCVVVETIMTLESLNNA